MSVCLAYIRPTHIPGGFCDSVAALLHWDALHSRAICSRKGNVIALESGPDLQGARNSVARQFVASDAEWLFMVDADMAFPPQALDALLAVAHPKRSPVVCGLCVVVPRDGVPFPPVAFYDAERAQRVVDHGLPVDELVEVDAYGLACALVHRRVLETVMADHPSPFDTHRASTAEDHAFWQRVRSAGFPIHVHTGVAFGHVKQHVYWPEVHQ